MQRRSAAIVLLSVCAVISAAGCAVTVRERPRTVVVKTPPPGQTPVYRVRAWTYRYYPEARVYYSCDRDMWFYMEGDRWVANVRLPNRFRPALEECVTIDLDTESPYEQDRAVVIAHPGRGPEKWDGRYADGDRDGPGNRGIGKAKGHSKHASADRDGDRDE